MRNNTFISALVLVIIVSCSLIIRFVILENINNKGVIFQQAQKPIRTNYSPQPISILENSLINGIACDQDLDFFNSIPKSHPRVQQVSFQPDSMEYSGQMILGTKLSGNIIVNTKDEFSTIGFDYTFGPDEQTLISQGWQVDDDLRADGPTGFTLGYRKYCKGKERILFFTKTDKFTLVVDPKIGLTNKYPGKIILTAFLSDLFQPSQIPPIYPKANWKPTFLWNLSLGGGLGRPLQLNTYRNEAFITSTTPSNFIDYYKQQLLARGWKRLETGSPETTESQIELWHTTIYNEDLIFYFGYDPVYQNGQFKGYNIYVEHN